MICHVCNNPIEGQFEKKESKNKLKYLKNPFPRIFHVIRLDTKGKIDSDSTNKN